MNNPFHILDSPEFSSNECDLPALRSLGLRGLPSTPTVAASTSELVDSLDTLHLERSQELGPDTLTRFPLTQPLLRPFELPPTPISPSPLAESSSSFTEIPEVFASQDYDITSYDGSESPPTRFERMQSVMDFSPADERQPVTPSYKRRLEVQLLQSANPAGELHRNASGM